jgi:hypothetical protein
VRTFDIVLFSLGTVMWLAVAVAAALGADVPAWVTVGASLLAAVYSGQSVLRRLSPEPPR